jgi:mannose-6-phosphate isomerase-like protein (cupin superfamily)
MSLAGNVYDGGSVKLEFLQTGAESDGALHEMRATYGPDSPLPPAHLHPEQDERFEILEGALTFLVDGEERVVAAGQEIAVPRGAVHQVRNAGDVPAVAIWQTRPALRTGEFHDTIHRCTAAEDWDGLTAALRDFGDVFRMVPDPFADA